MIGSLKYFVVEVIDDKIYGALYEINKIYRLSRLSRMFSAKNV